MNTNQRIPLLLIIAFGVCLGQILLETAQLAARTLVQPLIRGILGKVFDGMDSQYLQIGSFLSGAIGIAVIAVLLWLAWTKFAEPTIKKNSSDEPKP